MGDDMTLAEAARAIQRIEASYVPRGEYEVRVQALVDDLDEIKESMKWMTRFAAGQLFTFIVALLVYILNSLPT